MTNKKKWLMSLIFRGMTKTLESPYAAKDFENVLLNLNGEGGIRTLDRSCLL